MQRETKFRDPATNPDDSLLSLGRNQFTFSTNSVGTVMIPMMVRVEPPELAPLIAGQCQFKVGDIGSSSKQWLLPSVNGSAVDSYGKLAATVEFTDLPEHNNDFGNKWAELWWNGTLVASNKYQVFFPKYGKNHPYCLLCPDCPNWFYYWKEGGVCGIDPDKCAYKEMSNVYAEADFETNFINLSNSAAGTKFPHTFKNSTTGAMVDIIGGSKGIQCVADSIKHENKHFYHRDQFFNKPGHTDTDGDGIPDVQEQTNYEGISSDPAKPDTYNLFAVFAKYAQNGDEEIRCLFCEKDNTITVYPAKDWANPGCQHFKQFGPKVNP